MLHIGEASKITDVNIETIRYYERIGIIPKPARSLTGQRLFTHADIGLLHFVKRSRDLGFSITDIRALMQFAKGNTSNCADVKNISQLHLIEIRRKITDLQNLEHALSELVSHCNAGNTRCPMLIELMAD